MSSKSMNPHIKNSAKGITLEPGRTRNINHVDCPAGRDTRQRLYLTRQKTPTHLVLWYCHNCGEGGSYTDRSTHYHPLDVSMDEPEDKRATAEEIWKTGQVIEGEHVVGPCVWAWMKDRQLTDGPLVRTFVERNMRWLPHRQALAIAVEKEYECGSNPSLTGLVLRNFGSDQPKYLTYKCGGDPMRTHFRYVSDIAPYCIITEDVVSAFVAYLMNAGAGSYALFGTHCTVDDLLFLKEQGYEGVVVWLDNDNDTVRKHATQVAARATLLGLKAHVYRQEGDPKFLPPEEHPGFWDNWERVCTNQL